MEIPENLLEFANRCVTTMLPLCSNIDPEAGTGLNFVFSNFRGITMSVTTTASGLQIEELTVGTGATATAGQDVIVHYTGWLTNGTKFDSSKDRNDPFVFPLGQRNVIAGWDEGVQGMQVGGVRKLTIPPELGYGARGAGGVIPPNATLVFEVELLDVR
jgi:FKBP-type peptidyl-prolyl cis-trans isomerase FkpA